MSPDPSVADLLSASRQAHLRYRQHVPRMATVPGSNPVAQNGDEVEARSAVRQAFELRQQAEAADPARSSIAWHEDLASGFDHDDVMRYYASLIGS